MSIRNHAVVWIDHCIAKIFFLGLDGVDAQSVQAYLPTGHLHHKANVIGDGRSRDDPTFLRRVDEALRGSESILIVGPGTAKTSLLESLIEDQVPIEQRCIYIKPCDHPTDREIIAMGRRHFHLGEPVR
jgi:hypothetical protein